MRESGSSCTVKLKTLRRHFNCCRYSSFSPPTALLASLFSSAGTISVVSLPAATANTLRASNVHEHHYHGLLQCRAPSCSKDVSVHASFLPALRSQKYAVSRVCNVERLALPCLSRIVSQSWGATTSQLKQSSTAEETFNCRICTQIYLSQASLRKATTTAVSVQCARLVNDFCLEGIGPFISFAKRTEYVLTVNCNKSFEESLRQEQH